MNTENVSVSMPDYGRAANLHPYSLKKGKDEEKICFCASMFRKEPLQTWPMSFSAQGPLGLLLLPNFTLNSHVNI